MTLKATMPRLQLAQPSPQFIETKLNSKMSFTGQVSMPLSILIIHCVSFSWGRRAIRPQHWHRVLVLFRSVTRLLQSACTKQFPMFLAINRPPLMLFEDDFWCANDIVFPRAKNKKQRANGVKCRVNIVKALAKQKKIQDCFFQHISRWHANSCSGVPLTCSATRKLVFKGLYVR